MQTIDLHVHSTVSDGTDAPAELPALAGAAGLTAMALTDHDSVEGVAAAQQAGQALGIEVIAGIELSTDYRNNNVHVLGYFIDTDSPSIAAYNMLMMAERSHRNEAVIRRLQRAGFDVSYEALEESFPGAVLGRPHIGELLTRRGYASSVKDAFDRLIGVKCPFYLPTRRISVPEAVEVIRNAGGVPVLAHPCIYGYSDREVIELVDTAAQAGIRHLEVYYPMHTSEQRDALLKLAEERGFGVTGGTDYHGSRRPSIALGRGHGDLCVPYELLEQLREANNQY